MPTRTPGPPGPPRPKRRRPPGAPPPQAPAVPKRSKEELEFERQAKQLKADGYNSGVVARRMITEFGMTEPAALELVGRLYGKKINARAGDTTTEIVIGLGYMGGGLLGLLIFFLDGAVFTALRILIPGVIRWLLFFAAAGLVANGGRRVFLALVNMNVKEDLKP